MPTTIFSEFQKINHSDFPNRFDFHFGYQKLAAWTPATAIIKNGACEAQGAVIAGTAFLSTVIAVIMKNPAAGTCGTASTGARTGLRYADGHGNRADSGGIRFLIRAPGLLRSG